MRFPVGHRRPEKQTARGAIRYRCLVWPPSLGLSLPLKACCRCGLISYDFFSVGLVSVFKKNCHSAGLLCYNVATLYNIYV